MFDNETVTITRSNKTRTLMCQCVNCGALAIRPNELLAQLWADKHQCQIEGKTHDHK